MTKEITPQDLQLVATIQQHLRIAAASSGIPASRIHLPTTAHDPISRAARDLRNDIWRTLRAAGHATLDIARAFRVEHSTVRHTLSHTRKKYPKTKSRYV